MLRSDLTIAGMRAEAIKAERHAEACEARARIRECEGAKAAAKNLRAIARDWRRIADDLEMRANLTAARIVEGAGHVA